METRGRFVVIDPETYHAYYNVVANPMLWFIQHYLWDLSNAPDIRREELDAWENGYLAANSAFADAVNRELDEDPNRVVMLHDYHLYTAPEAIRAAHPDAFLHFFVHIPWSQPDYWRILPPHIREGILRGLLANDIVAFHTRSYARNFLLCCEDLLDLRGGLPAPPGALGGPRRLGALLPDLGQRADVRGPRRARRRWPRRRGRSCAAAAST